MDGTSNKKACLPDVDIEFFEELCLEFSQMLYDISEENNRAYCSVLARNQELEAMCKEYEKTQGSISAAIKIRLRQVRAVCRRTMKCTLKKIVQGLFRLGKCLTIRLGIKDKMKQTRLFRVLYSRGVIDKLRR